MTTRRLALRLVLLASLIAGMAWPLLAPHPLPFGISVQREMGFIGYAGIFALATLACAVAFPHALWRITTALLIAAFSLETIQIFIPTRGADYVDLAMNCVGILLGLVAFRIGLALLAGSYWKRTGQIGK